MGTRLQQEVQGELVEVPLSQIVPYEGQPRRFFDPKGLEELADSLQTDGQRVPVSTFRNSQNPSQLILIGGERRWRAFGLIQKRTGVEPKVRVIIEAVQDEPSLFRKALIDNLHRSDLIPLDEAAAYHRLHYVDKVPVADIAQMIGKSTTFVNNYLWLYQLPEEVKVMMDPNLPKEQRLAVSTAIQIARGAVKNDLRLKLAKEAVEGELKGAEVRSLIQDVTGIRQSSTGGRARKPSDDLVLWRTFLNRLAKASARHCKGGVSVLYTNQRNPRTSRRADEEILRRAIRDLQTILADMERSGGDP